MLILWLEGDRWNYKKNLGRLKEKNALLAQCGHAPMYSCQRVCEVINFLLYALFGDELNVGF